MTFAILSDDLLLRLESAGLSRDARLLYVEGIVYCATALTDGLINIRLHRISDAADPDDGAQQLVQSSFWEVVPEGFRIVHYLASEGGHQRSRERVERDRAANRKRQEDYAQRGRLHKQGDHSQCTSSCPTKTTNGVSDAVSNGVANGALSSPLRSEGKGERGKGTVDQPDALTRSGLPDVQDDRHDFADDGSGGCAHCAFPRANSRHRETA